MQQTGPSVRVSKNLALLMCSFLRSGAGLSPAHATSSPCRQNCKGREIKTGSIRPCEISRNHQGRFAFMPLWRGNHCLKRTFRVVALSRFRDQRKENGESRNHESATTRKGSRQKVRDGLWRRSVPTASLAIEGFGEPGLDGDLLLADPRYER
jgi:hypothetical protein